MKWSDEMLTEERLQGIERIVKEKGSASIPELMERMGISESTARRDLTLLDKQGRLQKVRGGAMIIGDVYSTKEDTVLQKKDRNLEEKVEIAKYAASLIEPNDFVYLDAGTTTEMMIDHIPSTNAVFVTNGIVHAKKLIAKGLKTYIIGGLVKPVTEAVIGADAVNNMKKLNFTKSFMGTNGIHMDYGFTTVDIEEAALKSEAMKRSYVNFVMADHTKFDKMTAVTFAALTGGSIITDVVLNPKYKDATIIKEVKGL